MCVCVCQGSTVASSPLFSVKSWDMVKGDFSCDFSFLSEVHTSPFCISSHPSPLFFLITLFFSFSFFLPLCVSTGLPSATRQKWWRTHWTQCGRLLRSLFELFAMVIMTGAFYFHCRHQALWWREQNTTTQTTVWIMQEMLFGNQMYWKCHGSI